MFSIKLSYIENIKIVLQNKSWILEVLLKIIREMSDRYADKDFKKRRLRIHERICPNIMHIDMVQFADRYIKSWRVYNIII